MYSTRWSSTPSRQVTSAYSTIPLTGTGFRRRGNRISSTDCTTPLTRLLCCLASCTHHA